MVLELGRFLVAAAGTYVATVLDVKQASGKRFIVPAGGMHHHLAASGNLGERFLRRNFPVVPGVDRAGEALGLATVVGCLCTPLDILAEDIEFPAFQPGDFICIRVAGAYAASASPSGFLSHPAAVELLV